jgi:hypothetical protein
MRLQRPTAKKMTVAWATNGTRCDAHGFAREDETLLHGRDTGLLLDALLDLCDLWDQHTDQESPKDPQRGFLASDAKLTVHSGWTSISTLHDQLSVHRTRREQR